MSGPEAYRHLRISHAVPLPSGPRAERTQSGLKKAAAKPALHLIVLRHTASGSLGLQITDQILTSCNFQSQCSNTIATFMRVLVFQNLGPERFSSNPKHDLVVFPIPILEFGRSKQNLGRWNLMQVFGIFP